MRRFESCRGHSPYSQQNHALSWADADREERESALLTPALSRCLSWFACEERVTLRPLRARCLWVRPASPNAFDTAPEGQRRPHTPQPATRTPTAAPQPSPAVDFSYRPPPSQFVRMAPPPTPPAMEPAPGTAAYPPGGELRSLGRGSPLEAHFGTAGQSGISVRFPHIAARIFSGCELRKIVAEKIDRPVMSSASDLLDSSL